MGNLEQAMRESMKYNINCKHEWVNADDVTRDKVCVKCGKRGMQGVMYFSNENADMATTESTSFAIKFNDSLDINKVAKELSKNIKRERFGIK